MATHQIVDGNNHFRRLLETGQTIRGIYQQFYVSQDPTFVVWDGQGSLRARRRIFPDYKKKDKDLDTNIFVNFDQIREVLRHTPVIQIVVPNVEADDVIAALVDQLKDVFIHSTDKDFLTLGVPCLAKPIEGVPPENMRLYKTFVGDASDKIPGCPGFGKGAWDSMDPAQLHDWLHNGAEGVEFPKRAKPDREQLLKYWEIIGFLPVSIRSEHITVGRPDPAAAETYFQRWMQ